MPPVAVQRAFSVDVFEREWDVLLFANANEVEAGIADVDFPVADAGRLTPLLQARVLAVSGSIAAPQGGAAPAR